MKVTLVRQVGGPERMEYADLPVPAAGPGQALVRVAAAGVNFIDVYHRTGLYELELPIVLGMEGAGVVEEVGTGVTGVAPGDRVAWAMARGSYAEVALVPAAQLVPTPAGLSFEMAAATMLQGMTAHYLTHSTFPLEPGHTALVHAAAGGTGLLLVQMAKMRGARVLGTVSTRDKAARARVAGADEVILYTEQDFATEARRLTGGRGVDVVYDAVGASTWEKSLNSLRPRGFMVSFGNASGPVPPFPPLLLNQKGSIFLTRPSLAHYTATREELLGRANDVLGWVQSGRLQVHIERTYPLADAVQAHRALESRRTSGKLLLLPKPLA